jgi:MSHA biogenesis protein MshQ
VYDGVNTAVECTTPGLTIAQCDTLKAATWTGVDSISTQGDCVADSFSNTINASGQYGCNFGNPVATSVFGRFTPDHFSVSGGALVNRSDLCPLGTGCPSNFTYIGEPMSAVFTLTAQAAGNSTTKNYVGNNSAGQLAKFNPAAGGNPLGLAVSYAAVSTAAAGVGATTISVDKTVGFMPGDALWIPGAGSGGAALNTTVASLTSNTITLNTPIVTAVPVNTNIERDLTGSLTIPSTATSSGFVAGIAANISAPLTVNRSSTNWYPVLNVGVAPVDGDGILAIPYNLEAAYGSSNDHVLVGSTDLRYGRIKIPSAHGSELLQLPISPVAVQYWNGLSYVTNTLDSTSSFVVSWTNCQKLSAVSTWPTTCPPPTSVSPSPVVFANGTSNYILSKPGTGNTGSVDMTTSTLSYLPSNTARAIFGIYKGANAFIYLRENY